MVVVAAALAAAAMGKNNKRPRSVTHVKDIKCPAHPCLPHRKASLIPMVTELDSPHSPRTTTSRISTPPVLNTHPRTGACSIVPHEGGVGM